MVPESQYELTSELFRRVMNGGRLEGELLHIIRGDGRQRLLAVDAVAVQVDGVVVGAFGVVRDISDEWQTSTGTESLREISLNELIRSMESVITRALGPRSELAVRVEAAPDAIAMERAELEQLVLDLVLNARSALSRGGLLSIRTSYVSENSALADRFGTLPPGSYVALTVTDDGAGIEPSLLQNVFGEGEASTSLLGSTLMNAREIVRSVGGHVSVLSEPRMGSVLRVYLPAASPDDSLLEPLVTHAPTPRKRILVVDDDEFVRRTCSDILEQAGYVVVQTSDGEQAVKTLSSDRDFAAAIVDVVLPSLGGREVAALLQQKLPSLPVVFTAGYSEEMIERHQILGDAPLYVQKPFTARELLSVTSLALAQPLGS